MSSSSSVSVNNHLDYRALPLEVQVAQLFMVGFEGDAPNAITQRFLERGVGGLIFFRDNFQNLPNASVVKTGLEQLDAAIPSALPRPLFGIDQEGGQVERLPHSFFPTLLTPAAVSLSKNPDALARDMYALMAKRLCQLGFNLDFFPTLDVNLNAQNPIIGVRSFAENADDVIRLSQIAMEEFDRAGLLSVGKHFPGHGNGTVDSHLDLPTLCFTEEELKPFRHAIHAGLPMMLVAHGFYPALQTTPEERVLPSSASPAIIQNLLRKQLGFEGVVITDDMCMGAITRHRSPVEAALASLKAGVDILLYKQSTQDEWDVYEAVLKALQNGALPMAQLQASLARIQKLKTWLAAQKKSVFSSEDFSLEQCRKDAEAMALRGISVVEGNEDVLPVSKNEKLLLVHPDRNTMGNYAFDVPTSSGLDVVLREAGYAQVHSIEYPPRSDFLHQDFMAAEIETPDAIVFVSFNLTLQPEQNKLYEALAQRFPDAKKMVASAGMPILPVGQKPDAHLALCSYRPATMQALVHVLANGIPH